MFSFTPLKCSMWIFTVLRNLLIIWNRWKKVVDVRLFQHTHIYIMNKLVFGVGCGVCVGVRMTDFIYTPEWAKNIKYFSFFVLKDMFWFSGASIKCRWGRFSIFSTKKVFVNFIFPLFHYRGFFLSYEVRCKSPLK